MLKFILYFLYFLSFSKDPFLDFRKYKTNKNLNLKNNFKFLGFAKNSPVLTLKGYLIYPLENISFKVIYLNQSCIRFYYKGEKYNVCR